MQGPRKLTMICCAAVLSLGLAACGGGGSDDDTAMVCPAGQIGTYPDCMDPPTPYETASEAIAAATTPEAAQAAYDAVKDDVTAAQGEMLQAAVDARIMALDTMARVDEQKMALSDAAGMINTSDLSTQALVDAANDAIRGLRQALEDADDVSDADKAMYMSQLNDAVDAVDEAQGGIDTATRRTNQMTALSDASDTLQAALAALSGSTPTQAELDAATNALAALNMAIANGADLTDDEKAPYQREANNAAAPIQTAQTAFDDAEDEAQKTANAAMAVTATKLHKGIAAQNGAQATTAAGTALADGERAAAYNDDDVPSGNTPATPVDTRIMVGIGTANPVALTEDKKNPPTAHHGWTGKRYTAEPANDGTYEAVVYSNVGDPTEGDPFNEEYTLNAADVAMPGELTEANADGDGTDDNFVATRVASSSFDQSAGTKEFKKGDNLSRVVISGSYHGVSGTYYCTPATDSTCAVQVAAKGFTLGGTLDATNAFTADGGTWTFKPGTATTKVMSVADAIYASYGWWIHKSADDKTYTASAFVDDKGEVPDATGLTALQGTATYMGGAAGKYALSSSTGGTNDAGHFTARATLNADFSDNSITGTIDNFMGADGMARDWSVELKEAAIANTGGITRAADNDTVWTIDGTAAAASGEWSGSLQDNGDDGVPKVATGTFDSTYGDDGVMVGAFGANKQ